MEDRDESVCRICKEYIHDLNHKNSVNHRYHFAKWAYTEYRKALLSNRHGVTVSAEAVRLDDFHFDFRFVKGKYMTKITPEQLQLHNNTLFFKCVVQNTRKDPIYVVNINLLHPSDEFTVFHSNGFGNNDTTFLQLAPGSMYHFKVAFNTNNLNCASYKIPLSCDFQTIDNKHSFSIVRTFLMIINDQTEEKDNTAKSPFTRQNWKDVKIIPSTKDTTYTDKYPIPREYLQLLRHGLRRFSSMNINDENNFHELKQLVARLTKENYNKFWHILLWLEEIAQDLMVKKYNMEGITIEMPEDSEILIIEVPGLAEKRPSVIVGDFILVRITRDHTAYKGFVCKVNERTVEISHVDDELLEYLRNNPGMLMDVSFMVGRLAFERMHHAVDRIVATGMVLKLFPSGRNGTVGSGDIFKLHPTQFFNKSICNNQEQEEAVRKILNCVHDLPYIVFGPPGTGKTITIVEAILQIKKRTKKKILVCAPANSACDMLATKLMPFCTKDELIRIHSETRERSSITDDLMEYSNIEDEEFTKLTIEKLLTYRIIVTTLTLIGRFAREFHPDCVFIDEAAQASEPETDIAVALLTAGKQVVLAGDPKQLGPMSTSCASRLGLGTSLLERLMSYPVYTANRRTRMYDSDFITMLKLNFRSHPDILRIPNELFYKNMLQPVSLIAQNDPLCNIAVYPTFNSIKKKLSKNKSKAIEFCSVSAKEKQEGSSPSFFNLFEVKMVVKYVKALFKLNVNNAFKVRSDQIGVVTPYKRQVYKIKESLNQNGLENIEVGTTESFQGREKRIIIISTVRAQHSLLLRDRKFDLGFVKSDQRFNVGITRAISKLVVVGCPLVLQTDEKWLKYMNLCEDFGTYFGSRPAADQILFKESVVNRMQTFKHIDDQFNH